MPRSSSSGSDALLPQAGDRQQYVVVRFSDVQVRDLELNVTNVEHSVIDTAWLRRMCRQLRSKETEGRRLRFIRRGAILTSKSALARDMEAFFQANDNSDDDSKFYVHCIVGTERLDPAQLAHEDSLDDVQRSSDSVTTQAIGLDRLRAVGFSEEEINLFREQFRATYGDVDDVGDTVDIRQLEEQWMETGVNAANTHDDDRFNSVPIANYKYNKDLMVGVTVGFCLGIFGLLLLKNQDLFNKRQKMAIIAGVAMNAMFSIARGF